MIKKKKLLVVLLVGFMTIIGTSINAIHDDIGNVDIDGNYRYGLIIYPTDLMREFNSNRYVENTFGYLAGKHQNYTNFKRKQFVYAVNAAKTSSYWLLVPR